MGFQSSNIGKVSLTNKMLRTLWYIVRFLLFRPFGTKLFLPWRLFLFKAVWGKSALGFGGI